MEADKEDLFAFLWLRLCEDKQESMCTREGPDRADGRLNLFHTVVALDPAGSSAEEILQRTRWLALLYLAEPYSDHPDFREEWKL